MFPFQMLGYAYYIIPVIQIIFILHALKTNRKDWLYLLIFIPLVGCVIYFIKEILPSLNPSKIDSDQIKTFLPNGKIKALEKNLKISDTETNRLLLAEEYAKQKNFTKAIELTKSCLTGIYQNNPEMMITLAKYQYGNEQYEESVSRIEKAIKEKNNSLDRPEDELLYAKALYKANEKGKAENAFLKIIQTHQSFEARYYYGIFLIDNNRKEEAAKIFTEIKEYYALQPRRIKNLNRKWKYAAQKKLGTLKAA